MALQQCTSTAAGRKNEKRRRTRTFPPEAESVLQVLLGDLQKSDSTSQTCWGQWLITSLNVSPTLETNKDLSERLRTEKCGESLVPRVTENQTEPYAGDPLKGRDPTETADSAEGASHDRRRNPRKTPGADCMAKHQSFISGMALHARPFVTTAQPLILSFTSLYKHNSRPSWTRQVRPLTRQGRILRKRGSAQSPPLYMLNQSILANINITPLVRYHKKDAEIPIFLCTL